MHENTHNTTIDAYIKTFPETTQSVLKTLRSLIHAAIPEVEESIRYNMPTFSLKGKYVIYFAAWKKHISLYPFTETMAKRLPGTAGYNTSGKGTIQFPLDKPLPTELVRNIITIRLEEM